MCILSVHFRSTFRTSFRSTYLEVVAVFLQQSFGYRYRIFVSEVDMYLNMFFTQVRRFVRPHGILCATYLGNNAGELLQWRFKSSAHCPKVRQQIRPAKML